SSSTGCGVWVPGLGDRLARDDKYSLRGPAAVDRVGRAGDGRRRVGREEYGERADALGLGEVVHRLLLGHQRDLGLVEALAGLLGARLDLLGDQRRQHPAGADGVAGDAVIRRLHGDHLGQADEAVLGGDVSDLLHAGDETVRRGDVDDAAPFTLL